MKRSSVLENSTVISKTSELPISYHTFIYPFTYEDHLEELILKDKSRWSQIHLCDVEPYKNCSEFSQRVIDFNEYQYFLPKARALLFDEKCLGIHRNETDCPSPIYKYITGNSDLSYRIIRKIDDNSFNETYELLDRYKDNKGHYVTAYDLSINQITIQLFPRFKTGIFTFELEYYSSKKSYGFITYSSGSYIYGDLNHEETKKLLESLYEEKSVEQDINAINDYGRRVCVPCLGIEGDDSLRALLNADRIVLSGLGERDKDTIIAVDFDEQFRGSKDINYEMHMDLISKIMFRGGKAPKRYNVKPVLDDRMFTACLYRNNNYMPICKTYSPKLRNNLDIALSEQYRKGDTYRYLEPALYRDEANELYKFVFLEDNITCHNIHMLKEKLDEHVLGRWIDYGTVYAATEYSLVCVTGESSDLEKPVINPFLSSYIDMVKLALVQRSIMTKLENKTQEISQKISDTISNTDDTQIGADSKTDELFNDVEDLWQEYIEFENQIYLPEVTFQEQGVEFYDLIKRSLRIKELNTYLKDEILSLHNIVTLKAERRRIQQEEVEQRSSDMISRNLNMLSIVGISLAIVTFIVNFISAGRLYVLDSNSSITANNSNLLILLQSVAILIMMYCFYLYYKWRLVAHSESWKSRKHVNDNVQSKYKVDIQSTEDNRNKDPVLLYINDIWWIPIVILIVFLLLIVYFVPYIVTLI